MYIAAEYAEQPEIPCIFGRNAKRYSEISYKVSSTLTIEPSNPSPKYLAKIHENLCVHKDQYMIISFIHNS